MDINQANILANKLDKLNNFFDITTSTVEEISKQVNSIDDDIEIIEEESEDIVTINMLRQDFNFIRQTLMDTVKSGKQVISKLSLEIEIEEGGNGSLISSYAELIGVVNNSLKLLSTTYKDIVDMNIKLKSKPKNGDTKISGDVTVNNINASVNDIVAALANKGKQ